MKTLIAVLVLAGSAFAMHAGVHVQHEGKNLVAYCASQGQYDTKSPVPVSVIWTHSETGKEIEYRFTKRIGKRAFRAKHIIPAKLGIWTVILVREDSAHGTELSRTTINVTVLEKPTK